MGREIKRIALDFDWPINTIWKGYRNPYHTTDCQACSGEETCKLCNGRGYYFCDDSFNALFEDWVAIEPPKGDGYQIWETVSDGSPISPIFKTPEELAAWAVEAHKNREPYKGWSFAGSFEKWVSAARTSAYMPSMVIENGKVLTGAEMVEIAQ